MDHLLDDEESPRHERELTLSTGSILAIFLGLVVLCGAFFGFGFNMGRKSAPTPLNMSDVATESLPPTTSSGSKPAAGSPMDTTAPVIAPVPTPRPARRTPPVIAPADGTAATAEPVTKPVPAKPATPAPAPIVRAPVAVPPAALSPSAPVAGSGTFMVQVAAVSHQEDAQLLIGALRARGYGVTARSTDADHFIHVQVGPFHDKKEADAMRQRLLTDGYNAIVK